MTYPDCPFQGLDTLWIQVAGLSCNLRCAHCFNASAPGNREMPWLSREAVGRLLAEASAMGVRDVVFTGGEPFLHPAMAEIVDDSLTRFPTTVLTNGTLLSEPVAARLGEAARRSRYSLEIRISLDAPSKEKNDAIRGKGSYAKAVAAVVRLEAAGLLPIVTAVRFGAGDPAAELEAFEAALRGGGVRKPRVKFLPVFRIGREEARSGAYPPDDRVTRELLDAAGADSLLCSGARLVTASGAWPCPILVNEPGARMGDALAGALGPAPLAYGACTTCLRHGAVCANAAAAEE